MATALLLLPGLCLVAGGAQSDLARAWGLSQSPDASLQEEAARLFLRLGAEGDPCAQYNLGVMHLEGRGVEPSDTLARFWFGLAAAQGHCWAQYNLGTMDEAGRGAAANPTAAARWYRKAAGQGDPEARAALARLLFFGKGVPMDRNRATALLRSVALKGDRQGQRRQALAFRGL